MEKKRVYLYMTLVRCIVNNLLFAIVLYIIMDTNNIIFWSYIQKFLILYDIGHSKKN